MPSPPRRSRLLRAPPRPTSARRSRALGREQRLHGHPRGSRLGRDAGSEATRRWAPHAPSPRAVSASKSTRPRSSIVAEVTRRSVRLNTPRIKVLDPSSGKDRAHDRAEAPLPDARHEHQADPQPPSPSSPSSGGPPLRPRVPPPRASPSDPPAGTRPRCVIPLRVVRARLSPARGRVLHLLHAGRPLLRPCRISHRAGAGGDGWSRLPAGPALSPFRSSRDLFCPSSLHSSRIS